ncbi:hypothetical protein ACFLW1_03365 [Chloroflexota bacterium]
MENISIGISLFAIVLSATTAWLTLFRNGNIRMTQPTVVFFGPDGPSGHPKIFLRTLLYSTAKRGKIVENMFLKIRRGESVQNFNIWVYGDNPDSLVRGSGLFVGENGVTFNHHFLLPLDGINFEFLAGEYFLETYVSLVGKNPVLLNKITLSITEQQAKEMQRKAAGLYFDWGPDSKHYNSHIDRPPKPRLY